MQLKTNWHFTKWDALNILFVIQYIRCFRKIWGSADALLQIPLKMGKKWKKFWVQHILWSSKILFCFESRLYIFFFKWLYSQRCFDVVQLCENRRWKWHVVSTLSNVAQFNVEKQYRVQRCKFQRWRTQRCFNVDLTLWDVATLYQPKINAKPTLKCLLGSCYLDG